MNLYYAANVPVDRIEANQILRAFPEASLSEFDFQRQPSFFIKIVLPISTFRESGLSNHYYIWPRPNSMDLIEPLILAVMGENQVNMQPNIIWKRMIIIHQNRARPALVVNQNYPTPPANAA